MFSYDRLLRLWVILSIRKICFFLRFRERAKRTTCSRVLCLLSDLSPADLVLKTVVAKKGRRLPTSLVPLLLCSAERVKLVHIVLLSWRSCITLCRVAMQYRGTPLAVPDQATLVHEFGHFTSTEKSHFEESLEEPTRPSAGAVPVSVARPSGAVGQKNSSLVRYVDKGQWKRLCSSGWYTFVGCKAALPEEGSSISCPWCALSQSPDSSDAGHTDSAVRASLKEKQAAGFTSGKRIVRSTFWCEWRQPTSSQFRQALLQSLGKRQDMRQRQQVLGRCLCRFHPCTRPLSLWIYRTPHDPQPAGIVWPQAVRLVGTRHRWMTARISKYAYGDPGCPLLQVFVSTPAPDTWSSFMTRGRRSGQYARDSDFTAFGWVWSFDIPDEFEVEAPLQTCIGHPENCLCNCRQSSAAPGGFGEGSVSGRCDSVATEMGGFTRRSSFATSPICPDDAVSWASVAAGARTRRKGFIHSFRWHPPLFSGRASLYSPTPHSPSQRDLRTASGGTPGAAGRYAHPVGRRVAALEEEKDRDGGNLNSWQTEQSSSGIVQDLRRRLCGYSIQLSMERFVAVLVSASKAPSAVADEYIRRHLRYLGAPAGLQERSRMAARDAQRPEVFSRSNISASWDPQFDKYEDVQVSSDEDATGTEQLLRQFGSGGLVLTFIGASVSGAPSLFFPQKEYLSFCLRSLVAENTCVLARSRRRVIFQALEHSPFVLSPSGELLNLFCSCNTLR